MSDDCVCEAAPSGAASGRPPPRVRRRGKGVRGAALAAGAARYLLPARPTLRAEPARPLPARASPRPPAGGAAAVVSAGLSRRRFGGAERGQRPGAPGGGPRGRVRRERETRWGRGGAGRRAGPSGPRREERAACGAVEKCRRRGRGAQRGEGAGRAARRGGGGHGPDYTDTNSQAALKE